MPQGLLRGPRQLTRAAREHACTHLQLTEVLEQLHATLHQVLRHVDLRPSGWRGEAGTGRRREGERPGGRARVLTAGGGGGAWCRVPKAAAFSTQTNLWLQRHQLFAPGLEVGAQDALDISFQLARRRAGGGLAGRGIARALAALGRVPARVLVVVLWTARRARTASDRGFDRPNPQWPLVAGQPCELLHPFTRTRSGVDVSKSSLAIIWRMSSSLVARQRSSQVGGAPPPMCWSSPSVCAILSGRTAEGKLELNMSRAEMRSNGSLRALQGCELQRRRRRPAAQVRLRGRCGAAHPLTFDSAVRYAPLLMGSMICRFVLNLTLFTCDVSACWQTWRLWPQPAPNASP